MWIDLTADEIEEIRVRNRFWKDTWSGVDFDADAFALAIQAALRIKNELAQ